MTALTEPELIERWSPVPFRIIGRRPERLRTGDKLSVAGSIGGWSTLFNVEIIRAEAGALRLSASGPLVIDAEYRLEPDDHRLTASVEARARNPLSRLMLVATQGWLARGVLEDALRRLMHEARAVKPVPRTERRRVPAAAGTRIKQFAATGEC